MDEWNENDRDWVDDGEDGEWGQGGDMRRPGPGPQGPFGPDGQGPRRPPFPDMCPNPEKVEDRDLCRYEPSYFFIFSVIFKSRLWQLS